MPLVPFEQAKTSEEEAVSSERPTPEPSAWVPVGFSDHRPKRGGSPVLLRHPHELGYNLLQK